MSFADVHLKEMQDIADNNAKYLKLAFLAAIVELRDNLVDVDELAIMLESGSAEDIMRATHIDDLENLLYGIGMDKDTFIFSNEVLTIFNAGATASFFRLPVSTQKVWNYNPIYAGTTTFLQEDAAQMAREIVASTKAGLQAIITRVIAETLDTATRIKEIQQLIGLTADQATAVLNFRRQLETRQLLGFTNPADRRLSALDQTLIRQHMQNGTLTTEQIDSMVGRYFESLLNKRATDIANTEAMNAVNNGQQLLWEQGLDEGVFSDNNIRKFWITAGDEKVRALHRVIPGMNPGGVKIRSMFITPYGLVSGPGSRTGGFINCRCSVYLGTVGNGGF
jgi:hypothetical protein